jgi:microcompartment protein CcmK/EutM
MFLGKVIGNIVCSMQNASLEGKKILIVQPLGRDQKPVGKPVIALDSVGAGAGETVYWARGREASFPWHPAEVPTECTIVGIVDHVSATGKS